MKTGAEAPAGYLQETVYMIPIAHRMNRARIAKSGVKIFFVIKGVLDYQYTKVTNFFGSHNSKSPS